MTIKHRHPAYQDQHQPTLATAGRFSVEAERGWTERNPDWRINAAGKGVVGPIPNTEIDVPHPLADVSQSEPDYEAITERRQERHRPDWA